MSPDHIMRAACAAIDYWCAMREEVSREAHRRAADVAIRNEEGYKRKLCEIHSAYKRAKTKQNELWQHSQDLEADKKELQNKYEVKSREKNRIEAAMNDLLVHGIRGPEVVVPPPAENVLRRSISESYAASGLHRRDRDGNERLDSTFRTTEGGNSLDRSHGGGTTQNCRRWSSFSKPSLSRTHLEDHNRNPAGFRSGGRTIRPFKGFRENLGQQGSGGGNYASFRPQSPSRSIFSI
ncbi:uncharacterized protein MICPUCDRAFT_64886 [Micromonas pusilla CCMP1545]|uniref:Predicted protein n=1 Tax=Micromonas pusilla (strain CCMP1545) TaxID=564608 RepID=C1ML83_MICPC|nr:uncharacterized protein MICPUCDRAFT_64886 [Micromonas pusilla CCMP1545]EEH59505.1 predicted protein [Micromonas pusilla CCMP1545]|mmetsp:Transcript_3947/g.13709  ORF Transcript_3947/g.13709 Transcript_3947/m.13709 type:complete len:237 (-) Transcript_3947:1164-1874(-)|eukprot:XP_003056129.1 predicted protein [Micromonas pusilla CCMP1545]